MTAAAVHADVPVARSIVGGQEVDAGGLERASENPARPNEPAGRFVTADADLASASIERAVSGAERWRSRSALDRGRILRKAAEILESRQEDLAILLTLEEGKTLADSRGEVARAVETLDYHASAAWWPQGELFHSTAAGDIAYTIRVPVGIVAIVTPWNFPVSIPVWKIAPALVHGNAVLWKPSTFVPLLSVALGRVFLDAGVEPDALAVLLGDGAIGAQIVSDARVDAVSFTGSEQVGRVVGRAAFERGAKAQLELGGHNPAIVLRDADLDVVVDALVRSIANQTGQKCTAARRIIVEEPVRDELVARLLTRFESLRIGDGTESGIEVGPLVTPDARDAVAAAVARGVSEGCRILGRQSDVPLTGAFFPPTLLEAPDQTSSLCREEAFGPVSVVLTAKDAADAFALARDTRYGLSAALFTSSERMVRRAVEELPVGMLNINRPTTSTELHMPFGGMKASSSPGPAEQGMVARDFYTDTRSVISNAVT